MLMNNRQKSNETESESKVDKLNFAELLLKKSGLKIEEVPTTTSIVLKLWNQYAVEELQQFTTIDNEGEFKGKVVVDLPQEAFYTKTGGYFQLRIGFPVVKEGDLMVKVILAYIKKGTNAAYLDSSESERGGEWTNITSNMYPLEDLVNYGYIAEEARESLYRWALDNVDRKKTAVRTLCPQSNVRMILRHTIFVTGSNNDSTRGEVGTPANIGMEAIGFENATILRSGGLLNNKNNNAFGSNRMGYSVLVTKYGRYTPIPSSDSETIPM